MPFPSFDARAGAPSFPTWNATGGRNESVGGAAAGKRTAEGTPTVMRWFWRELASHHTTAPCAWRPFSLEWEHALEEAYQKVVARREGSEEPPQRPLNPSFEAAMLSTRTAHRGASSRSVGGAVRSGATAAFPDTASKVAAPGRGTSTEAMFIRGAYRIDFGLMSVCRHSDGGDRRALQRVECCGEAAWFRTRYGGDNIKNRDTEESAKGGSQHSETPEDSAAEADRDVVILFTQEQSAVLECAFATAVEPRILLRDGTRTLDINFELMTVREPHHSAATLNGQAPPSTSPRWKTTLWRLGRQRVRLRYASETADPFAVPLLDERVALADNSGSRGIGGSRGLNGTGVVASPMAGSTSDEDHVALFCASPDSLVYRVGYRGSLLVASPALLRSAATEDDAPPQRTCANPVLSCCRRADAASHLWQFRHACPFGSGSRCPLVSDPRDPNAADADPRWVARLRLHHALFHHRPVTGAAGAAALMLSSLHASASSAPPLVTEAMLEWRRESDETHVSRSFESFWTRNSASRHTSSSEGASGRGDNGSPSNAGRGPHRLMEPLIAGLPLAAALNDPGLALRTVHLGSAEGVSFLCLVDRPAAFLQRVPHVQRLQAPRLWRRFLRFRNAAHLRWSMETAPGATFASAASVTSPTLSQVASFAPSVVASPTTASIPLARASSVAFGQTVRQQPSAWSDPVVPAADPPPREEHWFLALRQDQLADLLSGVLEPVSLHETLSAAMAEAATFIAASDAVQESLRPPVSERENAANPPRMFIAVVIACCPNVDVGVLHPRSRRGSQGPHSRNPHQPPSHNSGANARPQRHRRSGCLSDGVWDENARILHPVDPCLWYPMYLVTCNSSQGVTLPRTSQTGAAPTAAATTSAGVGTMLDSRCGSALGGRHDSAIGADGSSDAGGVLLHSRAQSSLSAVAVGAPDRREQSRPASSVVICDDEAMEAALNAALLPLWTPAHGATVDGVGLLLGASGIVGGGGLSSPGSGLAFAPGPQRPSFRRSFGGGEVVTGGAVSPDDQGSARGRSPSLNGSFTPRNGPRHHNGARRPSPVIAIAQLSHIAVLRRRKDPVARTNAMVARMAVRIEQELALGQKRAVVAERRDDGGEPEQPSIIIRPRPPPRRE